MRMNVIVKASVFGLVLFALSPKAAAQSEGIHTRIHHHYQSPRALGMGDAFVAIANDYSAILYNPAGLARREDGQVNLSMEFAGSQSFSDFTKDTSSVKTTGNSSTDYALYSDLLQKYYGKVFQTRVGLFEGFWVRPNWGVAFIPLDATLEYKIHNQVAPALNVRAYLDTTLAYGYGTDIKGSMFGRWSMGTTVKFVNRGYANKIVSAFDLVADSNAVKKEDLRDGYTLDMDIGTLYTPHLPGDGIWQLFSLAKPTFGAVLRNVGETGFGQSLKIFNKTQVEAPEKMYRVLDVGMKYEYPNIWIFNGRGALDIRDIGHPNFTWRKGFHLGFEFDWTMATWWKGSYRIGVNQGYPTLGFSALFSVFNLDLVTYGEDVGSFSSPKENRIYLVKLNIDL